MYVCVSMFVCACVCDGVALCALIHHYQPDLMYVCVCMFVCTCVCDGMALCALIHHYQPDFMYVCMCVHVCMCMCLYMHASTSGSFFSRLGFIQGGWKTGIPPTLPFPRWLWRSNGREGGGGGGGGGNKEVLGELGLWPMGGGQVIGGDRQFSSP